MALKKHTEAAEMPNSDSPTYAHVRGIILPFINGSDRSVQTTVGPSQAGSPCDRELVYKLTATEVHGDSNPWLPFVGTCVHSGLAEAMEAENRRLGWQRYLVEQRVQISDEIPWGTADVFDVQEGDVWDWKIVGKTTLDSVRRHGSKKLYKGQGHLYGLGMARLGYQVNGVKIIYLPRNANPTAGFLAEMRVDEFDFDIDAALAIVERMRRLKDVANTISPATRERKVLEVVANPSNEACFFCAYRRVCPDAAK